MAWYRTGGGVPDGTINTTPKVAAQTVDVSDYEYNAVGAIYEEINSSSTMDSNLSDNNNIGKMYKFTGTTDTKYTNGRLYICEEVWTASITQPSGTQIQSGISGLEPSLINKLAVAIANCNDITRTTTTCYVSNGVGYYTIAVGNQINIAMNGTDYAYDIIGFNHDTDANGNVGITFQMHDSFNTTYLIKSSMTTSDGWGNSDMRSTTMPLLIGYLPAAWQNILVSVNKLTAHNVSNATLAVSSDKMWLASEYEIFGAITFSKAQEGYQYAYYANGGSKIKHYNGSAYGWWERSPYYWQSSSYRSYFCHVNNDGSAGYYYASVPYSVSPCFAIGSQG